MITFSFKPKGVLGFMVRRDAGERYSEMWTGALTQAAIEYATGRLRPTNVLDRLKPSAFGTHGYRQRSTSYRAKQRKYMGRVTPFVSPRRPINFQKVAEALLKPSVGSTLSAMRDLEQQTRPHMKDVITKPGIGWRVRVTGKRRKNLKILWPAAKILNTTRYAAQEWSDLQRGGAMLAILNRAHELVTAAMQAAAAREQGLAA